MLLIRFACVLLIMPALFILGCDSEDTEIRQYTAPKDQKEARDMELLKKRHGELIGQLSPGMTGPLAEVNSAWKLQMTWTPSQGWTEDPTPASMRVATYRKDGLEMRIAAFPGDAGGLLRNINRWRGQMGLTPVQSDELATQLLPLKTEHLSGYWVTILGNPVKLGQEPDVFYGAILQPSSDASWFVTVRAPRDQITRHKDSIQDFVKSFKPTTADTAPTLLTPTTAPATTGSY